MILRSITSRLVVSYCLLMVLLGGAFLLFTVLSFRHYTRETITETLSVRSQEIWNLSQDMLDRPSALKNMIERRFAPESQNRFIRIRVNGRTLYRSGNPIDGDFNADKVPPSRPQPDAQATLIGNLLLYSRSFGGPGADAVIIDAGQSYQFARAVQGRLATSLSVGLPVLLLLASLAGYILMRQALTPIETMINAAEAYTFNDPHNRLPLVGTEPRIEALGLALNRMLDRLDNAYSHVSRFSADAAHELRTPLTIIRGELELVISTAKLSPDIERAISNALEEMARLSGIVDSLITLSRLQSLWGKRTHTGVDLTELIVETIDQMNLLAVEKNIRLVGVSGPPVMVAGDRDRLKEVLVNLLDNAIKYTPAGGQVTVSSYAADDKGTIMVEDTGIGVDPDLHDRIFDRFYRVSTDRGMVGAGLGLAIVKSICQAHGGSILLRSAPQIGSCFTVELPLMTVLSVSPETESKVAAAETAAARESQTRQA